MVKKKKVSFWATVKVPCKPIVKSIKVLNLYAGIGGNRKLWPEYCKVTAVENNPEIAAIYQDFFPNDTIIVCDAHQYLLEHFQEFDFIWSSPPCPSHSRMRFKAYCNKKGKAIFPDMKLYEEILFLQQYFNGKWVVENVKSWYDPLVKPQECGRHYIWSNCTIPNIKLKSNATGNNKGITLKVKMKDRGFIIKNWHEYKGDKRTLLNNCTEPELGQHIFKCCFLPPPLSWIMKCPNCGGDNTYDKNTEEVENLHLCKDCFYTW